MTQTCEECESIVANDGSCPTPENHVGSIETDEERREREYQTKVADLANQKAAVTAAQSDLKKLLAQADRAKEVLAIIRDHVEAVEPIPLSTLKRDTSLPTHEWVLVLSDWHIGQLTTLEETGGMFEQNSGIALEQVQTLWNAVDHLYDIEAKGRNITKLHILSLGDMVDGDLMRISQTRKVDQLVSQQYPMMYGLMEGLIRQALRVFDEVDVHVVGGNHDRFGKFGDAGLGELSYIENWSYVMGTSLEGAFRNEPRVVVRNHQSFFGTTIVSGHKFVFSHGSDVNWRSNSYAGIPYYSLNVAAERMKAMVNGFDALVMGHGHIAMQLPVGFDSAVYMNGSLPGSSTFVQSKYKSIRRPSQTLIDMHHRLGMTGHHKLYLDHEGLHTDEDIWNQDIPETRFEMDLTPTRKRR